MSSVSQDADPSAVRVLVQAQSRLRAEVAKVIIGQEEIIAQVMVCLLAQGHVLLVGVPGLAKTLLIRTLADALDLDFSRIQFTPDLMPGDITGTDILEENQATGRRGFRFVRGPIFAHVVLADEVNRTPPKTQGRVAGGDAGVPCNGGGSDLHAGRAVLRSCHTEPH